MKSRIKSLLFDTIKKHPLLRSLVIAVVPLRKQLFRLIHLPYKTDEKTIIFESFSGRSYSDSPKAIYQYLVNNPTFKDYRFVWAFQQPEEYHHLSDSRTSVVRFRSKEHYKSYAKAKYWFSNARLGRPIYKKRNQIYIQTWHGTPFKRLAHDIIKNNKHALYSQHELAKMYDQEAKLFDYIVSPSQACSEIFSSCFDLPAHGKTGSIIESGYPRNDFLSTHTKKDVVATKDQLHIPKDKKVLLYAPTWRDNHHDSATGYTHELPVDIEHLHKQLSDEWIILFRAHYLISNQIDFDRYSGFIYDVSHVDDINELFIVSDALMTDYSSVFFDYANLGRPMIFFMYDLEKYRDDLRGFYIEPNTLPGDIVRQENDIVSILTDLRAYQKKHFKAYKEFNGTYTYLDDGKAAERVTKKIFKG
jgi:CDP-glycerol glycerophosphotransferase